MNTDDLIQRFLDGQASPEEAAELSRLIETNAEARNRYLDLAELHALLAADETLRVPKVVLGGHPARKRGWISTFRQMAAGIVLGGVAVSAVWAYALPKGVIWRELPLVEGGFERVEAMQGRGVPTRTGVWGRDPSEIVGEHGEVRPHSGKSMFRFIAADRDGDRKGSKHVVSDVWQTLELPGRGPRLVKVRAWFNAQGSKQSRFHLLAVASSGGLSSADKAWKQRDSVESPGTASSRAMVFVDQDPATWERGELVLRVPAGARTLIVGVAAYAVPGAPAGEWFPAQFVDDVSVVLSDEEVLP